MRKLVVFLGCVCVSLHAEALGGDMLTEEDDSEEAEDLSGLELSVEPEEVASIFGHVDSDGNGALEADELHGYLGSILGDSVHYDEKAEVDRVTARALEAIEARAGSESRLHDANAAGTDLANGADSNSVGDDNEDRGSSSSSDEDASSLTHSELSDFWTALEQRLPASAARTWARHAIEMPRVAEAFADAGVSGLDFPSLASQGAAALRSFLAADLSDRETARALLGIRVVAMGAEPLPVRPPRPRVIEGRACSTTIRLDWGLSNSGEDATLLITGHPVPVEQGGPAIPPHKYLIARRVVRSSAEADSWLHSVSSSRRATAGGVEDTASLEPTSASGATVTVTAGRAGHLSRRRGAPAVRPDDAIAPATPRGFRVVGEPRDTTWLDRDPDDVSSGRSGGSRNLVVYRVQAWSLAGGSPWSEPAVIDRRRCSPPQQPLTASRAGASSSKLGGLAAHNFPPAAAAIAVDDLTLSVGGTVQHRGGDAWSDVEVPTSGLADSDLHMWPAVPEDPHHPPPPHNHHNHHPAAAPPPPTMVAVRLPDGSVAEVPLHALRPHHLGSLASNDAAAAAPATMGQSPQQQSEHRKQSPSVPSLKSESTTTPSSVQASETAPPPAQQGASREEGGEMVLASEERAVSEGRSTVDYSAPAAEKPASRFAVFEKVLQVLSLVITVVMISRYFAVVGFGITRTTLPTPEAMIVQPGSAAVNLDDGTGEPFLVGESIRQLSAPVTPAPRLVPTRTTEGTAAATVTAAAAASMITTPRRPILPTSPSSTSSLAAAIDEQVDVPPELARQADASHCALCGKQFGLRSPLRYRARHHCRRCMRLFCDKCGETPHHFLTPCGDRCTCRDCLLL